MSTPVPGSNPDSPEFIYDEFGYFSENCAEYGLVWDGSVDVERVSFSPPDAPDVSGLRWGSGSPRIVFLHGGAQNAHTWDTVALALRPIPLLCLDMPGHGHSAWRDDGRYDPRSNAAALAAAIEGVAPDAELLVGMSLGGLTANAIAASNPGLFDRMVVVDVTPGVTRDKAKEVHDFIAGPQSFPSFQEIFDRTVEFNPTRTPESLRRGILHNAHRLDDGSWKWNYDRGEMEGSGEYPVRDEFWTDVDAAAPSYLLVRGGLSPVVYDDDVAELMRRRPDARVVVVDDAGHSVQGDQPNRLADIVRAELER